MRPFLLLISFQLAFSLGNAQGFRRPQPPNLPPSTPLVHDVALAQSQDGTYHMLSTGMGLHHHVSDDLENWTLLHEPAIKEIPTWTHDSVPGFRQHVWAPDLLFFDGKWWLAYSCSTFGKNTSAIGLMCADSLTENTDWTDKGAIVCSKRERDNWNAIDPNLIIDNDGNPWLAFGSFWDGIQLLLLDSTLHISNPRTQITIARRSENPRESAIEAPFIFHKNGFYYLFVSWDICCQGERSTYKVAVGRSENIRGPYLDKNGNDMAKGGGSVIAKGDGTDFYALGHCALYDFGDQTFFFCHGYSVKHDGMSVLIRKHISWDEQGWPQLSDP